MAAFAADGVLNAALDQIETATQIVLTVGEPANGAGALSDAVAEGALTGGDFTQAEGDVSGRKVTIAQQDDLTIDESGTPDHVALLDVNDDLVYVTTVDSPQALTEGGTVTLGSWQVEFRQPD